ncbi:MAG: hypothetical protein JNM64_17920, partial [Chloroflexia bacterium]|nr:hypothetical protein [Chloroflexia bacterium]
MSELITADAVAESPQVRPALIRANLLTFGRRLRDAGLPVGSGQIMSMLEATAGLDLRRHEDIYHAAKATLVTRPEQIPVFDAQFARFWRELLGARPVPLDPFTPDNIPSEPPLPDVSKKKTEKRQEPTGTEDQKDIFHISEGEDEQNVAEEQEYEAEPDDIMLFSAREQLRKKDFSQCSAEEIAEARRIIEGMTWRLGTRRTRRRQRRKIKTRPLVVICDISG